MNLTDFSMLCYSAKYNLYDIVLAKFSAEQYLNKYLLVSAPGEAAPSVKQSYIRLKVDHHLDRLIQDKNQRQSLVSA